FEQQPGIPCRHRQLDQERRLDLARSQKEAGNISDREGLAAVEGYIPHPTSQGPVGPVLLPVPILRYGNGLFKESKGGEGLPALGSLEAYLRPMVHFETGLHTRANGRMAEPSTVAKGSGHAAIPLHCRNRSRRGLCRVLEPRSGRAR